MEKSLSFVEQAVARIGENRRRRFSLFREALSQLHDELMTFRWMCQAGPIIGCSREDVNVCLSDVEFVESCFPNGEKMPGPNGIIVHLEIIV